MIQLACDFGFVTGLMGLGAWLETVGEFTDIWDQYFTPLPLGGTGLLISFIAWGV